MRNILKWLGICIVLLMCSASYLAFFSSPQSDASDEYVTVPLGTSTDEIFAKLAEGGFITQPVITRALFDMRSFFHAVAPGGYVLSKDMSPWTVARVLAHPPHLRWVVIPEGLRKEEVADLLAISLEWNREKKDEFLHASRALGSEYEEGVYFPDTYLIPHGEGGIDVAARMISRFNEKFAPYAPEFVKENIKWDTALKLASIVQREAAGRGDLSLVAGILWIRLLKGMRLEVDATVQYARGNVGGEDGGGWWAPLKAGDTKLDSPYNTYLYKGLPPHPIANPGTGAIEAVLNPVKTDCMYYLHDANRQIHCAETFEEHRGNIERYLK